MNEMKLTSALAAFEFLLEELEDEVEGVNRVGARAFDKGDHEGARSALNRADQLRDIRHKVATLRDEWETLLPSDLSTELPIVAQGGAERKVSNRLPRGLRTPEKAYYLPILKSLVELGGSARMDDVLTQVGQVMHPILKSVDYDLLNSTAEPRWRNAGQWARDRLVKNGYMSSMSPHGIWEITEKGRRYLAEHST